MIKFVWFKQVVNTSLSSSSVNFPFRYWTFSSNGTFLTSSFFKKFSDSWIILSLIFVKILLKITLLNLSIIGILKFRWYYTTAICSSIVSSSTMDKSACSNPLLTQLKKFNYSSVVIMAISRLSQRPVISLFSKVESQDPASTSLFSSILTSSWLY